jgi:hypothetical protein
MTFFLFTAEPLLEPLSRRVTLTNSSLISFTYKQQLTETLHRVQSRPKARQVPHLLKQNQSLKTLPHLYNGGGPQCEELGLKPD